MHFGKQSTFRKSSNAALLLRQGAAAAGALIFQQLFWRQEPGLNVLLYLAFVAILQLVFYPTLRKSVSFRLVAAATLFAALMLVVQHTVTAGLTVFGSFFLLLGFANQPRLRLLLYAAATGVLQLLTGIWNFGFSLFGTMLVQGARSRGWFYLRLVAIPLLGLGLFHVLFSIANTHYNSLAIRVISTLADLVSRLLPEFSIEVIVVLGIGLVLTCGALFLQPLERFAAREARQSETIERAALKWRSQQQKALRSFRLPDLKKEYLSALLLLALLNGLLLVVNSIDINWLWFGFVPTADMVLAEFVQEGTYVLIGSILLAMAILLYYFRGNLNFIGKGQWLRWAAYAWIVQNAVLAISVALRNYHYIMQHGLAYKRIGVIIFLLLTLFGLLTVYVKIRKTRSLYFLLRTTALAAYVMLLAMCCLNWDTLIARYNLRHPNPNGIDYDFLVGLSDKALPELLAGRERLPKAVMRCHHKLTYQAYLDQRIRSFVRTHEIAQWPSYAYAEAAAYAALKPYADRQTEREALHGSDKQPLRWREGRFHAPRKKGNVPPWMRVQERQEPMILLNLYWQVAIKLYNQ